MTTLRVHSLRLLLPLAAAALVLSGCSAPAPAAPAGPPVPGDASGAPVDEAPAARPAIDLDCDALLAAVDPAATFGIALAPTTVTGAGTGDYLGLASAATASAGGLLCRWDDASGADLQVIVLPDAADEWAALSSEVALFQPRTGRFGDASFHACMAGCRADALVGDRWVSAVIGGAPSEDAAWELVDRAIAAVAAAGAGAPARDAAEPLACDALVPAAVQAQAVGGALAADTQYAPTQPVLLHGAVVRLGGTHCYWRGEVGGAAASIRVGVVPGGADAWAAHWAIVPDAAVAPIEWDADPLLGDEARAGCFERSCFVSVRVGADWVSVDVLHDGGDRLAAATRVAEEVLAHLG